LFPLSASATEPADPQTASYTIFYTGRLFGYFRYPELQKTSDHGCPSLESNGPLPQTAAPEALAFQEELKTMHANTTGTELRVAVGDNFAPYLLGRDIWDNTTPSSQTPSKTAEDLDAKAAYEYDTDQKKWVHSNELTGAGYTAYIEGQGAIPTDNVACFLMAMQFDAIVPGAHDFIFGPERPREIARFMVKPTGQGYHTVRMLGANLYFKTRYLDPEKPFGAEGADPDTQPAISKPVSSPKGNASDEGIKPILPKVSLPWMRAIRIRGSLSVDFSKSENESENMDPEAALQRAEFTDDQKSKFDAFLKGTDCISPKEPNKSCPITGTDPEYSRQRREFVFTRKLASAKIVCPDPNPKETYLTQCRTPILDLLPEDDSPVRTDVLWWIQQTDLLQPNTRYQIETTLSSTASDARKGPTFVVQMPYFEYPYAPQHFGDEGTFRPWVYKNHNGTGNGQSVAIFGVVDPDLRQYIGRLNSTWLSVVSGKDHAVDNRHETDLEVSDSAEALLQALEMCRQDEQCKSARKILLAEMPRDKVYTMLGTFHALAQFRPFDAVIAQADPDHATGNNILLQNSGPLPTRLQVPDIPILVPGSHFRSNDPYHIRVRLQAAMIKRTHVEVTPSVSLGKSSVVDLVENTVYFSNSNQKLDPLRTVHNNTSTPTTNPPLHFPTALANLLGPLHVPANLVKSLTTATLSANEWKVALDDAAVAIMRDVCHADLAILQQRDVFVAPDVLGRLQGPDLTKQDALILIDAMFWKGDGVECLNVPGQTINNLLKRSKELERQEENGLATDLTIGWDLITLGADEQSADDNHRLIDGQFLDPKKLYAVAATDFLADGSTGYPALQGAEPPPSTTWSTLHLRDLTALVGDRIVGNSTTDDYYLAAKFQDRFVKPGPRPEPQAAFSKWAKGAFADFDQFGSMSDFERFAQEIPRWSIFLYKADASYSASVHTGTESSLGQRFPGVGFVDLGGANSSSYLFDYSIRAQHDTRRWQFYLQSDFSYAYKKLRGKTNQYARSEPADYWYEESGMALRLDPRHQNPSGWKLLIPVGFRHQIPPLVQIAPILPNGKSPASSPSPVRQEADLYPAFRPGIRWDYLYPKPNQSAAQERSGASSAGPPQSGTLASYLEAGYQVGELLHSPDGYQFSGGTTCYVETLIPCLTKIGASSIGSTSIVKSVIGGRQHLQDGLYLDFRFDLPIPFFSKVEYVNENRGDFFFGARGDAVVDTRFYDDWRQSLKIPINHKLSIAPTIELILFQNKIAGNFYRDYSTFVALNYSLDWHWKLDVGRVANYPNPVPTQSALPNR
jgi:hypothetical protein